MLFKCFFFNLGKRGERLTSPKKIKTILELILKTWEKPYRRQSHHFTREKLNLRLIIRGVIEPYS
jgi:hypothetical protein